MNTKIPITSYKTFLYAKAQLEQELANDELALKYELASKIPFGLGNVLLNKDKKKSLTELFTKEAVMGGMPLIKKMLASFLNTNKKKFISVGISVLGGLAVSLFLGKKLSGK